MILAKPSGIELEIHVDNVQEQLGYILAVYPFISEKYKLRTERNLEELCSLAVQWHDEGKKHHKWQEACQNDYKIFLQSEGKNRFIARNLLKTGVRHEMESLIRAKHVNLPNVVKATIAAHHGKLNYGYEHRWLNDDNRSFSETWYNFVNLADRYEDNNEAIISSRYEYSVVRSTLQLADRRASAMEDGELIAELRKFQYEFPHKNDDGSLSKNPVQKKIEELQDLPFAILRAPTGAGKTDACLLWAQHQIEQQRADRLVIAMPTRFTANSLSISITENLGSTGLFHSTSLYQMTKEGIADDEQKKCIIKEQEYARLLLTPVTVTTIDHLCMCLTGKREEHHTIFANLSHSCLVIDEADFYDRFTQENILVLLQVLRVLNVPVLIMSATIPDSMIDIYRKSGNTISTIFDTTKDDSIPVANKESEKVRVTIGEHIKAYTSEEVESILKDLEDATERNEKKQSLKTEKENEVESLLKKALDQPTIIYANTVKNAQAYYQFIRNYTDDVVLYHSRFTEPDKAKKEEKILSMLGKKAWQNGEAHGIVILTQIGEISVNISAHIMITEICPIDRLIQRIGRLDRFDTGTGILHIIEPLQNDCTLYPAPYGSWNKDTKKWDISSFLVRTLNNLIEKKYTKFSLLSLVNKVYSSLSESSRGSIVNVKKLERLIRTNWLILPASSKQKQTINNGNEQEDDNEVDGWKCRDIDPQTMIYFDDTIGFLSDENSFHFKNWGERREFDITNGINISLREFHKILRIKPECFERRKYAISFDDEEELWVIGKRYYQSDGLGLYFDGIPFEE